MGKGGGSKVEVTEYRMSIWYAFAMGPVDKITRILIDKKEAWVGSESTSTAISINKPDLFGGIRKEGGAKGVAHYFSGASNQKLTSSLITKILFPKILFTNLWLGGPPFIPEEAIDPDNFPAHRGISSIFFAGDDKRGFYFRANQPSIPPIEITAQRKPVGLSAAYAMIGDNANVVHFIYEILTNTLWGIGMPPSVIKKSTFETAAQTTYNEGIAISMLWREQQDAEAFVAELLEYVEGVIFVNPRNGLIEIKLIRGGYDVDDLFEINPSNAKLSGFQRKGWGDTINELTVSWTNPESEELETVSVQDLANIGMQGRIVSMKKELPGVRSSALAMKLATRDLRVASSPLATCRATVNRSGWSVTPGDVVKLSWPEHGIETMAMRVTEVDYGKTTDSAVKVTLVEDIFGLDAGEYFEPPSSGWGDTLTEPAPIDFAQVFTLPYYLAVQLDTDIGKLNNESVYAAVLGADENVATSQYTIVYEQATPTGQTNWVGSEVRSLVSRSTLAQTLPFEANSLNVNVAGLSQGYGVDADFIAAIGASDAEQEICIVTAVGENGIDLLRGCLDTIPREWPVDTPIWFIPLYSDVVDDVVRAAGQSVTYRLLSSTSIGTLSVDDAPDVDGILTYRPWLPNRPANCKVNGQLVGPVSAIGATSLSLSWANRNRTLEDSVVLAWNAGSIAPESGQTTTISVLSPDGSTVIQTINGLTGTTYALNTSGFGAYSSVLVKFTSKNATGQSSLQGHSISVQISAGYGNDYGNNYGGA